MTRLTRLSLPTLALALVLGACDSNAPSSPPPVAAAAPLAHARVEEKAHAVTETSSVWVEGETLFVTSEDQLIELSLADAYLIGQVMSSVAIDALPSKFAEVLPPARGGDRCDQGGEERASGVDFVGEVGFVVDGVLSTKCPPRPPTPIGPGLLDDWFEGTIQTIQIEDHYDWQRIPGGFVALDFDPDVKRRW